MDSSHKHLCIGGGGGEATTENWCKGNNYRESMINNLKTINVCGPHQSIMILL